MGNGIQEGEVIRILNPYLIVTFSLRTVKPFIHFDCIFIQFHWRRVSLKWLRQALPAQA